MQKSATSARAIEPASPSMTLMTPVGFSTVSPPGRTMHHSKSLPTPPSVNRASWLFLSVKMDLCGNQPSGAPRHRCAISTQRGGRHDRHHEHLEHEGRLVLGVARADRGHDGDALHIIFFHRRDHRGRACVRVASTVSRGCKDAPSVSIVGPTSFVLPPSEMMTPSTSPPSKTFSTSCVG